MSPNFPFWLGSALVLVSALIVYLFIEEPKEYEQAEQQPGMLASLREVLNDEDKSGLRLLFAIFFWFVGYSALETFFTLYARNRLGLEVGDSATLLSVLPLFFVLFAIPSGFIAKSIGRRVTITIGLIMLIGMMILLYLTPAGALLTGIAPLPLVGIPLAEGGARMLTLAGVLLIFGGIGWAFININSLPMIVDLTSAAMGHSSGALHALPERIRAQTALDYMRTAPGVYYIPNEVPDTTQFLSHITLPTLVVWGDRDRTLAPSSFPKMVEAMPRATGKSIRAGHVPHQSNAEEFNPMVLEFLRGLDEGVSP